MKPVQDTIPHIFVIKDKILIISYCLRATKPFLYVVHHSWCAEQLHEEC
jgi:hypothetical protein